ncbi:MAG TPA: hypothetical protein VI522_08460, partial [Gammaproteobacteria bacterium]|nr:hypothetical protein [Gammaproteobacteria bacterium]
VPPEAWGEHVWTVNKVQSVATQLLKTQTDGFMLWSMHKDNEEVSDSDPDFPSANLLASSACDSLLLADATICAQAIHHEKNSTLTFRNDSNENGIYFVVDAMPYGYPRTENLNVSEEDMLTGTEIPIVTTVLPLYVYAKSIGYETACINQNNGQPITVNWAPKNIAWQVNFWLDNNGKPMCSAGQ